MPGTPNVSGIGPLFRWLLGMLFPDTGRHFTRLHRGKVALFSYLHFTATSGRDLWPRKGFAAAGGNFSNGLITK